MIGMRNVTGLPAVFFNVNLAYFKLAFWVFFLFIGVIFENF